MRAIVIASLIALSFTTGFTCSKNAPTEPAAETPAQEQMAAPAPTEGAPTEAAPAPTEAAPAPTEGAPAAAPAPGH
jgi:hypothetical protein